MAFYTGTETACKAYNAKVSDTLGFTGSITSKWADIRKHPSKSLFAIVAHNEIKTDSEKIKLVESLTEDWNDYGEL